MNIKPPCGHSNRVLPTLDTGDDFVGLLHNRADKLSHLEPSSSEGRWNHHAPDELFPFVHKKQRNDVKHVGALQRWGGVTLTSLLQHFQFLTMAGCLEST